MVFAGRVYETRGQELAGIIELRETDLIFARVVDTMAREAKVLVDLDILSSDGEFQRLTGTPEHPFWNPESGAWIPMGDLLPSDSLMSSDGQMAVVMSVGISSESAPVFNISVEAAHNYFVSGAEDAQGVLVHNECDQPYTKNGCLNACHLKKKLGDEAFWNWCRGFFFRSKYKTDLCWEASVDTTKQCEKRCKKMFNRVSFRR